MSKIPKELIGTWWAYKASDCFCLYRGNNPPIGARSKCGVGKDAITSWYYPTRQSMQKTYGKENFIRARSSNSLYDCSGITFPPEDYIEEGITEIEILENGDYIIFDTITFNNYNNNGTEQSV